MAGSITGATAVIMLSIPRLFPAPFPLQGFGADDIFDTDAIESVETLMGVDGKLSGGFVFVPVRQNYTLQADSDSIVFFDEWWATQKQIQDVLPANGVVLIPSVGKKWTLTRGFLKSYKPIPDIKKLAQPQRFAIEWQELFPAVV